ncbi:hypothetical protein L6452_12539 [Arctium lappa]|uniref:Uncharacterized protein n=1 Tax=Arctium lappa TaxID=4217 RepID=A0ACB9DRV7_ARCLA|nr:hypothetical protein L6452_12539 [Arctium lappa]
MSAASVMPEILVPGDGNEETQSNNGIAEQVEVPRNISGNDKIFTVGNDSMEKGFFNHLPSNPDRKEQVQVHKITMDVGHYQELGINSTGLNSFSGNHSGPEFIQPNKEISSNELDGPTEGTRIVDHGETAPIRETGSRKGETISKASKGKQVLGEI